MSTTALNPDSPEADARAAAPVQRPAPRRGQLIMAAVLAVAAIWWAVIALATGQPWTGLEPRVDGASVVAGRTAHGIAAGARLLALVGPAGERLPLQPGDLIEEPDMHPTYGQWALFLQRQGQLLQRLRQPGLQVQFQAPGQPVQTVPVAVAPGRPWNALPAVFWFQLLVGSIGALVGTWVLALRRAGLAHAALALTGWALLLAAATAAIYSSRELALPPELFMALSRANHIGTALFGVGLMGVFGAYPRRLVPTAGLALLAAGSALWTLADILWWLPRPQLGLQALATVQMTVAIALGVWQWRRARGQPAERAALRWILLSFLVGCGAFVVLIIGTTLAGWLPPLSQGYAFGFFLLMYLGLAAGVRRYRLFDMDRWSLRVLMWVFGLTAIVAMDALLLALRFGEVLSLAASVLVCAAVYFPLRQWLWGRLFGRAHPPFEVLAERIAAAALAPPPLRAERWRGFLADLLQPMRLEPAPEVGAVQILDEGLGLAVPGVGGQAGLRLWQRSQGRRLFSGDDQRLVQQAVKLFETMAAAQAAYERGASEERQRIATDLHDDLGARLLAIVQTAQAGGDGQAAAVAHLSREALEDMRISLRGLVGRSVPAAEALADWRAETAQRLQAAGFAMQWELCGPADGATFPARLQMQLARMLREAVSNAIRHSGGRLCRVRWTFADGQVGLEVDDDGRGWPAGGVSPGLGLPGIERRARLMGGQCETGRSPLGGARLALRLPLHPLPSTA